MKRIILALIIFYQEFLSILLKQLFGIQRFCRYKVTCSEYAKEVIAKEGILIGSLKTMSRILHCQPFGNSYEYL